MKRWEDSLKKRLAVSPDYALEYLNAALEERDEATFLLALRQVAEAQTGATADSDLRGGSLYRSLAESGNPRLTSLTAVLDALGLQFVIARKEAA